MGQLGGPAVAGVIEICGGASQREKRLELMSYLAPARYTARAAGAFLWKVKGG